MTLFTPEWSLTTTVTFDHHFTVGTDHSDCFLETYSAYTDGLNRDALLRTIAQVTRFLRSKDILVEDIGHSPEGNYPPDFTFEVWNVAEVDDEGNRIVVKEGIEVVPDSFNEKYWLQIIFFNQDDLACFNRDFALKVHTGDFVGYHSNSDAEA